MITGFLRFEGGYESEDDLKKALKELNIPDDGYIVEADQGES